MDNELIRLWGLVADLSEQLNANRVVAASLQSQAIELKSQVASNPKGFALRRYNTDISKEAFESELERSNAATIIENQTLLREHKQLSSLLKEYEHALETVMTKFRAHAYAAQQHELTLARHYEALLAQEGQMEGSNTPPTLVRLSKLLRLAIRSMAGETDPQTADTAAKVEEDEDTLSGALQDWSLEREAEIVRLEQENADLRKLLGISPGDFAETELDVSEFAQVQPFPHRLEFSSRLIHSSPPPIPMIQRNKASPLGQIRQPLQPQNTPPQYRNFAPLSREQSNNDLLQG